MLIHYVHENGKITDTAFDGYAVRSFIARRMLKGDAGAKSNNVVFLSQNITPLDVIGINTSLRVNKLAHRKIFLQRKFEQNTAALIRLSPVIVQQYCFDKPWHIVQFCRNCTFAYAIKRQALFMVVKQGNIKACNAEYVRYRNYAYDKHNYLSRHFLDAPLVQCDSFLHKYLF